MRFKFNRLRPEDITTLRDSLDHYPDMFLLEATRHSESFVVLLLTYHNLMFTLEVRNAEDLTQRMEEIDRQLRRGIASFVSLLAKGNVLDKTTAEVFDMRIGDLEREGYKKHEIEQMLEEGQIPGLEFLTDGLAN